MILMVLGLTLSLIHIYHPDRRITKVAAGRWRRSRRWRRSGGGGAGGVDPLPQVCPRVPVVAWAWAWVEADLLRLIQPRVCLLVAVGSRRCAPGGLGYRRRARRVPGGLPGGAPGGLPGGRPGGLPGAGGGAIPGMGGGGAGGGGAITASFMPERVQVRGLTGALYNLTAKQVLDIVTMSFDYPIQYVILDQGVVFVQKPASQQGYFTRTFKLNPSAVLGFQMTAQGNGGGGGQGGGLAAAKVPVAWIPGGGAWDSVGGGMDPSGGMGGGPGGGQVLEVPGGPQMRQLGGYPAQGQGFVPRGFQRGNRFNGQPFNQQNFGVNRSFQRFNSLTPGYGQSRVRGRQ